MSSRLRRAPLARDFQPQGHPIRRMAERAQPVVKASMRAALKHLRLQVPVHRVAALIRLGDLRGAAAQIPLRHFEEVLKEPFGRLGELFEQAANHGTGSINAEFKRQGRRLRYRPRSLRNLGKDVGDGLAFDRFDEDTQQRLRDLQDSLIAELSDGARDTIAGVIESGVRNGDTADEIASNIRDTITLTDRQAEAVSNYRRYLEDLDSQALERELRNKELDAEVQDAIDSGEFLSDDMIESLVADYADNYLDYRANTIARTETLRAANEGLRDSYRQAADRGVFPEEAVTRRWQIATDERVCPICQSIVENNPEGVGLNDDFNSNDGPADDPPVHVSCRCTVEYVTNLDMLPEDDGSDDGS